MKKLTFIIVMMALIAGNSFGQSSSKADSTMAPIWVKECVSPNSHTDGTCNFLVFRDNLPWGSSAVTDILTANAESFTVAGSAQMATLNFSLFDVIIIESDQVPQFYVNFVASFSKFDSFVTNGGRLEVHAATCGWNSPCPYTVNLPGGTFTVGQFDSWNDIADPTHPIVAGVPDPFYGNYASHGYFSNLVTGTAIITTAQSNGMPTTIQYSHGTGTITATCCTYEFGYDQGQAAGTMLANNLNYSCGYIPPGIPISNWAIILGIFLIAVFMVFRFRKRLA